MIQINSKNSTFHRAQPVPLSHRRSPLTMGLLWLTMVTSFPAVLAGFEWYRQGITFHQLLLCGSISILLLLIYSIPACELGSRTGLGYCCIGKSVFGRWGAGLLTVNLIWMFMAWYGLTAVLMAQAIINLFHWQTSVVWLSIACAFLMSFNNLFSFTGVANFARFLGGPVLIIWVAHVFLKALTSPTSTITADPPAPSNMYALSLMSSFIIGFAVWGNEQDYWRYSKPGIWRSAIPLAVAVAVGQIIFPVAGWLIARTSGNIDYASTATFMSNYCFGSIAVIGLVILMADYFSTNDSSLFGCATAVEDIWPEHNISVAIFAAAGASIAALLSLTNMTQALSALVSLNCIVLPTPTIIMITEWWMRTRFFKMSDSFSAASLDEAPSIRIAATIALFAGIIVGICTSGLFPVLEFCHFGIAALNAWLTSTLLYIPLRLYENSKNNQQRDI